MQRVYLLLWMLICGLASLSCSTTSPDFTRHLNSPLSREFQQYSPSSSKKNPSVPLVTEPEGALKLRQALALALTKSPTLKAFSWEIKASDGLIIQAGLFPNPEIEMEAEEFGGRGARKSIDGLEATLALSQAFPLGGRISKAVTVAEMEKKLLIFDYESKRLDVFTAVTLAFIQVVAAQEHLDLATKLETLTRQVLESVTARVQAGKVSSLEQTKAEIVLASSKIALRKARKELMASKKNLSTFWGNPTPRFAKAKGNFYKISEIPPLKKLISQRAQNPDLARWKTEMEKSKASLNLEKSKAIPDLTVMGGVRYYNEDQSPAFVLGLSIPLPIFDRNQGSILEKQNQLYKVQEEKKAVELAILSSISADYERLKGAFTEVTILKNKILPSAKTVFTATTEGYRQGKYNYLQVLDAQRTLFQVQFQYIDGLSTYHQLVANMERLMASRLNQKK